MIIHLHLKCNISKCLAMHMFRCIQRLSRHQRTKETCRCWCARENKSGRGSQADLDDARYVCASNALCPISIQPSPISPWLSTNHKSSLGDGRCIIITIIIINVYYATNLTHQILWHCTMSHIKNPQQFRSRICFFHLQIQQWKTTTYVGRPFSIKKSQFPNAQISLGL